MSEKDKKPLYDIRKMGEIGLLVALYLLSENYRDKGGVSMYSGKCEECGKESEIVLSTCVETNGTKKIVKVCETCYDKMQNPYKDRESKNVKKRL